MVFFCSGTPKTGWIFHELFKFHSVRYIPTLVKNTADSKFLEWNVPSSKRSRCETMYRVWKEMRSDYFVPLLNTSQSKENLKS